MTSRYFPHWFSNRLPDLIFVVMLGLAFVHAVQATGDLAWPHDPDLYRDIAHAQTILDGGYLADPLYRDEQVWYNPLVPTLVAGISGLMRLPVHLIYTRSGAYLNLLAPLSFYILVTRLFDKWTAIASAFGFLFISGNALPSWASATYSPWLFAANLTQALFYLALLVYHAALSTEKPRWHLVFGLALGVTFLGHSAPAILLGGMIGFLTLRAVAQGWDDEFLSPQLHRAVVNFCLIVLVAAIVSAPFLYSIVGHYRFRVLNLEPGNWIYPPLALPNFWSFVDINVSGDSLIASFGLLALALRRSKPLERLILLTWLVITASFIVYNYVWQVAQQNAVFIPGIVPMSHFLFYFKAIESVLFGYGLTVASRFLIRFAEYLLPPLGQWFAIHNRLLYERGLLGVILLVASVKTYPAYVVRGDLVDFRGKAQDLSPGPDTVAILDWMRAYAQPSDVFLASDQSGFMLVGPSGRKVVAVGAQFSNPYVDWSMRSSDRDRMFDYLWSGDMTGFQVLSSKYHVTYVLASKEQARVLDGLAPSFLHKRIANSLMTIYQVDLTPPATVNLDNRLEFLGSTLWRRPDGKTVISLHFRCLAALKDDYTMWFHASSEQASYNFDHTPAPPTWTWQPGQLIRDDVVLDVPAGSYRIVFGLWMWQDGRRLYRTDNGEHEIEVGLITVR